MQQTSLMSMCCGRYCINAGVLLASEWTVNDDAGFRNHTTASRRNPSMPDAMGHEQRP